MLEFKEPCIELKNEIQEFKEDFIHNNEVIHGGFKLAEFTIEEWIQFNNNNKDIDTVTSGYVSAHTFFALVDGKIVGIVNARHNLNDYLLNYGGHIGYSVRKSERNKGYAKSMLKYACSFLFSLGLDKILVTCDHENIASKKTIESCGGVLENIVKKDNSYTLRYWIYKK